MERFATELRAAGFLLLLAVLDGCSGGQYAADLTLLKNQGSPNSADLNTVNAPCGTAPSGPPITTCAGDPINYSTGNAYLDEQDYRGTGAFPVNLYRHYNSQDTSAVYAFGSNWHAPYSRSVTLTTSTTVSVTRDDGRVLIFTLTNGVWTPGPDVLSHLAQTAKGWVYTTGLDETETYNSTGQLISYANRAGLTQTFSYYANGNLKSATDAFGRSLQFAYRPNNCATAATSTACTNGLISSVIDPAGEKYSYSYDANNNLISVTFPDGSQRRYVYADTALPHALTGVIDENGVQYTTWTYTTQSTSMGTLILATSTQHAGGADLYTLDYSDAADGNINVTQPLGAIYDYSLQAINGLAHQSSFERTCSTCQSSGGEISFKYDSNGNPTSKSDFNGNTAQYTFDPVRNLQLSRTEAANTAQARTITTTWHSLYRLPLSVTEPNRITTFNYDGRGNLLRKTVTSSDGNSRSWNYTYDINGQVLTAQGPRTDITQIAKYAYDADGTLATITDPLGHTTQITSHDANGRPLSLQDPNGLAVTLTWNFRGQLTSQTVGGELTSFSYDPAANLTRVTLPDNSFYSLSYDAAHRLIGIADILGNHIAFTLDAAGNHVQEQVFDASNNLSVTRSSVFDGISRLVKDIGAVSQTTSYSYDENGNVIAVSDPLGNATQINFDALNRVVFVNPAVYSPAFFTYDANDHLTSVQDSRELTTMYTWNGLDNALGLTSPDTGNTSRAFDAAGNVSSLSDANGRVANYSYDALNRPTQIRYSGTTPTNFSYDQGTNGIGHLTSMSDASGNTSWTYDQHGRVTVKSEITDGKALTTKYAYDASGHLTSMAYPSGATLQYVYHNGLLMQISLNGSSIVSGISYQPLGPAKTWTWGNGIAYQRAFDQDGRLASYPLSSRTRRLTYDSASRITAYTDSDASQSQSFAYDAVNRLTQYTAAGGAEKYSYLNQYGLDMVGNRTSLTTTFQGESNQTYTYASYPSASNRLTSVSTGTRVTRYGYDPTGNTTSDGINYYTYDGRNRLIEVSNSQGLFYYQINGLGQRVAKLTGQPVDLAGDANDDGVLNATDLRLIALMITGSIPVNVSADCNHDGKITSADIACVQAKIANMRLNPTQYVEPSGTTYAYDEAGHLIGEYSSNGTTLEETIYMGDTPVAVVKGGTVYFIYADQLNAPRAIVNNAGSLVWDWEGNPFGATPPNQDPTNTGIAFIYNMRFPGQYYDAETGLHYNYLRDYNPNVGRYIESDPIGLRGGINSYVYVSNTPQLLADFRGTGFISYCAASPSCYGIFQQINDSQTRLYNAVNNEIQNLRSEQWFEYAVELGVEVAQEGSGLIGNSTAFLQSLYPAANTVSNTTTQCAAGVAAIANEYQGLPNPSPDQIMQLAQNAPQIPDDPSSPLFRTLMNRLFPPSSP